MREPRPGWWLAGLVGVALLLPSRLSIPIATFVLVLVAASRWWIHRVTSRLWMQCRVATWAHFDQDIEAVLEVQNGSRLPVPWTEITLPTGLDLGRSTPHRDVVVLSPQANVSARVHLKCLKRGQHRVGPPRVRIGDVFGIVEAQAPAIDPATVTVFPRIVPMHRLGLPATFPIVTAPNRQSLLVDPMAIAGIREYRPGDPFSSIHWPATARARQLVVKHYQRAEARETLICLDLCHTGYTCGALRKSIELAITVAASVLHHSIVEQGLPAGLVAASWDPDTKLPPVSLPPRSDQGHLRAMLEFLALADCGETVELAEVLASLGQLPAGTTLLVITGNVQAATAAHLLRLTREGVSVAVALTGPSSEREMLSARSVRVPVYRLPDLAAVTGLAGKSGPDGGAGRGDPPA